MKAGDANFGTLGAAAGSATHMHQLSAAGQALVTIGTIAGTDGTQIRAVATAGWTATARVQATSAASSNSGLLSAATLAGTTDSSTSLPPSIALTPLIKS